MTQIPQDILNTIYRFNSHPCADLITGVKQDIDYDVADEDFITELISEDKLEMCLAHKYHYRHDEYLKECRARARSEQNYLWDTYGDDSDDSVVNLHVRGNVANSEYTDSDSDNDTPIVAVSRRDPSIRVEVNRIPRTNSSDSDSEDGASLYPSDEVFYQFQSRDVIHPRYAQDRWTS